MIAQSGHRSSSDSMPADSSSREAVKYRRRPDASSGYYCLSCEGTNNEDIERLPKDYKHGQGWNSSNLRKEGVIDVNGKWNTKLGHGKTAMPIRQLLTYCVDFGCRYGMLLSTEKVFILRVRPKSGMNQILGETNF